LAQSLLVSWLFVSSWFSLFNHLLLRSGSYLHIRKLLRRLSHAVLGVFPCFHTLTQTFFVCSEARIAKITVEKWFLDRIELLLKPVLRGLFSVNKTQAALLLPAYRLGVACVDCLIDHDFRLLQIEVKLVRNVFGAGSPCAHWRDGSFGVGPTVDLGLRVFDHLLIADWRVAAVDALIH
jgi:hypothetical protein